MRPRYLGSDLWVCYYLVDGTVYEEFYTTEGYLRSYPISIDVLPRHIREKLGAL